MGGVAKESGSNGRRWPFLQAQKQSQVRKEMSGQ